MNPRFPTHSTSSTRFIHQSSHLNGRYFVSVIDTTSVPPTTDGSKAHTPNPIGIRHRTTAGNPLRVYTHDKEPWPRCTSATRRRTAAQCRHHRRPPRSTPATGTGLPEGSCHSIRRLSRFRRPSTGVRPPRPIARARTRPRRRRMTTTTRERAGECVERVGGKELGRAPGALSGRDAGAESARRLAYTHTPSTPYDRRCSAGLCSTNCSGTGAAHVAPLRPPRAAGRCPGPTMRTTSTR